MKYPFRFLFLTALAILLPSGCEHSVVPVYRRDAIKLSQSEPPGDLPLKRAFNQTRILIAGDSIMEDFGPVLKEQLRNHPELEFILAGKRSTGLVRPDFYDWPKRLNYYMERGRPDILVFCVGANDPQPIRDGGLVYALFSPEWKRAYAIRVSHILGIASRHGVEVIWMGIPVMGKEPLASQTREINELLRYICRRKGVPFVDTAAALSDRSGNFLGSLPDREGNIVKLRSRDKVHVTQAGNKLLTRQFLPYLIWELKRLGK